MSVVPVDRMTLLSMKAMKDEADRRKELDDLIVSIYKQVLYVATNSTRTSFQQVVPRNSVPRGRVQHLPVGRGNSENTEMHPLYKANMEEILRRLQELFPDSLVSHTLMAQGTDGIMYDISRLDDTALPFVNQTLSQSYINIDWSLRPTD
jgi:hypothetical protein